MKEYIYLLKKIYFGHFWMPTVDHCDENQLESANGC